MSCYATTEVFNTPPSATHRVNPRQLHSVQPDRLWSPPGHPHWQTLFIRATETSTRSSTALPFGTGRRNHDLKRCEHALRSKRSNRVGHELAHTDPGATVRQSVGAPS